MKKGARWHPDDKVGVAVWFNGERWVSASGRHVWWEHTDGGGLVLVLAKRASTYKRLSGRVARLLSEYDK